MRRIMLSAAILMGGLAQAGSLQAGVYNLDPPRKYPSDYVLSNSSTPWWRVKDCLNELRGINDRAFDPKRKQEEGTLRESYKTQLAKLETRQNAGILGSADCVNLSACLIRLGRYSEAEKLLEESLREEPSDNSYRFLLLLHRAALYMELDPNNYELQQRALRFEEEGLRNWPALLPGWDRWESSWYRHAEEHMATLMELRQKELISQQRGFGRQMPLPDLLFPRLERNPANKVRFIGESGKYEAGGIAWNQMNRLPPDALSISLQLLLWRPHDNRLNWLYGELLNAAGRIDEAFDRVDYVKSTGWQNPELDSHHRTLQRSLGFYERLFVDKDATGNPQRLQASILWALAPRGGLLSPGLGGAANELGGLTASTYAGGGGTSNGFATSPSSVRTAPGAATSALPDWRQLTVSFITGVVVAVLGVLQWQQWRRHRRDDTATSVRTESVSERSR
jgi:tetratricopeptide (TPR) repeat protein